MSSHNYPSPTAAQYAVVHDVYKATGILTVKDPFTADFVKPQERCGGVKWEKPWQDRKEYGEDYRPNVAGTNHHEVGYATLTRHRRAVRIDHFGTPNLPNGIAVGGVETWCTEDTLGQKSPQCVRFQSDMSPDEENRLARWARNIKHGTQQEYDAAEDEGRLRSANRTATQIDPAGALVKALAPALAQMAAAQQKPSGPSDDELRLAGFYKDAAGTWKRGAPEVVGGAKK